jgi:hypothetical protein
MRGTAKSIIIFFTFLQLCLTSAKAQYRICIGIDQNTFITALNHKMGLEAIFYGDSLKIIDLNLFKVIESKKINFPSEIKISDLTALYLKNTIYLFRNNGGEVYQLTNDSLLRIDDSFNHKMQQGSFLFEYQDYAFRYGGFGFWAFRNFFTSYNFNTKGWEIVLPEGSKEFPQGSGNGTIAKVIGDSCYIFGGEEANLQAPIVFQPNNAFWIFHISTKKWELLGEINPNLNQSKHMVILGDDNKIIYLEPQNSKVLDLEKNEVKIYKNNAIGINLYEEAEDHRICNYEYKGAYYLLFRVSSQDKYRTLLKTKRIYSNPPIGSEVVFQSHTNEKEWFSVLISLIVGLILIMVYTRKVKVRKKNRIQILNGKLLYKQRIMDLTPQQLDLMNLFVKSNDLSSHDILEIISNDHLHYTQNMRNLHKIIDELNLKLQLLTNDANDLILEEKSQIDGRIKIYKINSNFLVK